MSKAPAKKTAALPSAKKPAAKPAAAKEPVSRRSKIESMVDSAMDVDVESEAPKEKTKPVSAAMPPLPKKAVEERPKPAASKGSKLDLDDVLQNVSSRRQPIPKATTVDFRSYLK